MSWIVLTIGFFVLYVSLEIFSNWLDCRIAESKKDRYFYEDQNGIWYVEKDEDEFDSKTGKWK